MNLGIKRVIMLELAFDSRLGEEGRKRILDAYALKEGDEAKDVETEVGSCPQVISLPILFDKVLR